MDARTKLLLSTVVAVALVSVAALIALTYEEPVHYSPVIIPSDFVSAVDNEFFPLAPGTVYIYEGVSSDGNERNEVNVTFEIKVILGVTCVVVRDTVWVNGELSEQTLDWFAQDKDGNVWYFGEDSKEYSGGVVVSTEGSWEAGIDGAKPGIIMQGSPAAGQTYRQEYLKGEAEDMAEVLALNVTVTIPYGSYSGCLLTKEWTPLEREIVENKYFAPGIGMVLEQMVQGGSDMMNLVSITNTT